MHHPEPPMPGATVDVLDGPAQQREMPFALVYGQDYTKIPEDLYIPPDALEVFLDAFSGPLDLLLYLIRRQNMDILDVEVAEITRQYIEYIDLMKATRFELAAEYLVMAAMLAEIKSRMLLPRPELGEEEEDPRAELIRRLQEYERFKRAAQDLDSLPRLERDLFVAQSTPPTQEQAAKPLPQVSLTELLRALGEVLKRAEMFEHHRISRETLSTRERMGQILDQLRESPTEFVAFTRLFHRDEGRHGVVVTFLALMELVKEVLVEVVQAAPLAPIHVRGKSR